MRPPHGADPPVPGIIDTLTAGFQMVNRVPWILAVPVALDLLLWLGPKLSVAGVVGRALGRLVPTAEQLGQGAGPAAADQLSQLQEQVDLLRGLAEAFNLLSLLAFTGLAIRSAVPPDQNGLGGVIEVPTASSVAGLAVLLALAGIALGCVWLGALAQQVRDGRVQAARLVTAAPRYWLAIVAFLVLAVVAMVALMVPVMLAAVAMQIIAPGAGAGGLPLLFSSVTLVAVVFLYFLIDAILVSEVGPVRAALYSVRVVSSSFGASLGFIIITWVIMGGMGVIWTSLARAPAGQAVAILGNGYIESGLAAASMLFYRNRISRLTSSRGNAGLELRRD